MQLEIAAFLLYLFTQPEVESINSTCRKEKGITQAQLADKLEYSQIVRRKLKSLRAYLKAEYGEEVSKKSIKKSPIILRKMGYYWEYYSLISMPII